jgi:hypothetical protein
MREGGREGSAYLDCYRQVHEPKKEAHLPRMFLHGQKQRTGPPGVIPAVAAAVAAAAPGGGREEEAVTEGVGGDASAEEEGDAAASGFG